MVSILFGYIIVIWNAQRKLKCLLAPDAGRRNQPDLRAEDKWRLMGSLISSSSSDGARKNRNSDVSTR